MNVIRSWWAQAKRFKLALVFAFVCAGIGSGYYIYQTLQPRSISAFEYERDADQLLKLFKDNWYWLVSSDDYDPVYAFKTLSPNKRDIYFGKLNVKVIRKDDKFIGFVSYYKKNFYEGFILFLVVDPAYRGQGYAEKLLRFACDDLFAQHVAVIRLVTRPSNHPAQKLYNRVGFTETWRDETFVYFEKRR